jgi:hypothetical protein
VNSSIQKAKRFPSILMNAIILEMNNNEKVVKQLYSSREKFFLSNVIENFNDDIRQTSFISISNQNSKGKLDLL